MYKVKKFNLEHMLSNKSQIFLLVNNKTLNPLVYPFIYSLNRLRLKSLSSQRADLTAIKEWYTFWKIKKKVDFCRSYNLGNNNPELFLNELDNFLSYQEDKTMTQGTLIRLRNNQKINYDTVAKKLLSVIKFHEFLIDLYFKKRYQDIPRETLELERKRIDKFISFKKKQINNLCHLPKTHFFKSMNMEMYGALYEIINPKHDNQYNPFKGTLSRHRNFLIVHLLLNYGLRVSELLLLTTQSIKSSIQSDKYNLIIGDIDDEYDFRSRKPQIKNEYSYRVITLSEIDYQFIQKYIQNIRKDNHTQRLFTSLQPPYPAISYAAINKIFNQVNSKLQTVHPVFFDENRVDSINKLTPHVCRHTWAYITLKFAYEKYQLESTTVLRKEDVLFKAQEDLRILGGWSIKSSMPSYYARRFISERANEINIKRIEISY